MILSAQYALPHHIWVYQEALGSRYETYIGPVRAAVVTPPAVGRSDLTVAPPLDGVPNSAWDVEPGSEVPQWTTTYASFGTDNATALRRVGLELTESNRKIPARYNHHEHDQLSKIADISADWIEHWFLQIENWVSVVTGEDIDHRQPVFDANINGPGLQTWRHGGWQDGGFRIQTPRPQPLSKGLLQAVLDRVGDGEQPPIEHQLWRDSRAAFVRGDTRKAVLDAATAVEVCVIALVAETETLLGQKYTGRPGLIPRSNWTASNNPNYTAHDGLQQLAKLRNATIHAGEPATYDEARSAVQVAIDTVDQYGGSRDPRRTATAGNAGE